MKDEYSSGGMFMSVPGRSRSTRRGDFPEETLDGAVFFVRHVPVLSESNMSMLLSAEPVVKLSTGEMGDGPNM